jgi:Zn-dependent protease with chaperone function
MKYSGNLPTTNVNVTEISPLKEIATLVTGLLLFVLIIYWILGLGIDFAVENLTPQQEQSLSLMANKELFSMSHKNEISSILQKTIDALQNKCVYLPYKVNIYAIDNKGVNAIALPGGTILVFSGLLKKVRSENELTFILAHELGHFKNKDHLRGMGRAIVLMVLFSMILGESSGIDEILTSFFTFSESSHSRAQESKADAKALKVVQCHYGHVGGSTKLFEGMLKEEESRVFGHFLASHPTHTQRIKNIENQINKFGYKQGAVISIKNDFTSAG